MGQPSKGAEFFDLLPAIVWERDVGSSRFAYISQMAEKLLGYPTQRWLDEPDFWLDHVHPDDRECVVAFCADNGTPGQPRGFDHRFLTADDQVVWLRCFAWVPKGDEQPNRCCGVMVDVTDEHRATEDLRRVVDNYAALYNRTPIMMHSIDREGRLISVSDRWLKTLGYTREEVLGRHSVEFLTPESQEFARQEVLPEFFRTGSCEDIPYQIIRKDGTLVDVLLSATCEWDEQGEVQRSLAVMIDVTERLRTEATLRQRDRELQQAQKMEAVGRLAGGIAHDFNNLLVAILGHGEMLAERIADPALRVHAEGILQAGQRASALTRQILGFSRQQPPSPKVVDLNHLVDDTNEMLQRLLREDIQLATDLEPDLGAVEADPAQLVQVLLNLATNASDAMPSGGRLTLRTRTVERADDPKAPPARWVLLAVEDTGVGMDAEAQAHAFAPFFTTKAPGKGTGLGLSTVHSIVEQCGGTISLESKPGQGTTFRIRLPLVDKPAEELTPPDRRPLQQGTGTILVVEDNDVVRAIVDSALRTGGYTPLLASSAEEALALARDHTDPLRALLTDVVLPSLHGFELAERFVELHPESRVIFMSGYTANDLTSLQKRDFLPKPFGVRKLLDKLAEVLARPD